jgi:hypothetical protein
MTRPGRVVLLVVAFLGAEVVAVDMFASAYFNSVDEHAAPVVGDIVLGVLLLIIVADFAARGGIAAARGAARLIRH